MGHPALGRVPVSTQRGRRSRIAERPAGRHVLAAGRARCATAVLATRRSSQESCRPLTALQQQLVCLENGPGPCGRPNQPITPYLAGCLYVAEITRAASETETKNTATNAARHLMIFLKTNQHSRPPGRDTKVRQLRQNSTTE